VGGSSGCAARVTPASPRRAAPHREKSFSRCQSCSGVAEGTTPAGAFGIVNHIPHHAVRQRRVVAAVHAHGLRAAASERALHARRHAGDGKIITMTGMPARPRWRIIVFRFSSCCAFFGPSSNTSCNVPGRNFDRLEFESLGIDAGFQRVRVLVGPQFVRIAVRGPSRGSRPWAGSRRSSLPWPWLKVIDEVRDDYVCSQPVARETIFSRVNMWR